MKVLVAGGAGFIGSQLVSELKAQGYATKSISRTHLNSDNVFGDIGDPSSYLDFLEEWRPEFVIQAAWVTEHSTYRKSPANRVYEENSVRFAKNCFRAGVKHFFGLGSSAEYGHPSTPCAAGKTLTVPVDLYGECKVNTATRISDLALEYQNKFTWGRIFQPFGLNQDPQRFVPTAIRNLRRSNILSLENPDAVLDWVTTRDIASALIYALRNEVLGPMDIGTGTGTSVLDFVRNVANILNVNQNLIEINQDHRKSSISSLFVDQSSPLLYLGWKPQDTIESGLRWVIGA